MEVRHERQFRFMLLFSHRLFKCRSKDNLYFICFLFFYGCYIEIKFVIFLILIFTISILCILLLPESYGNFSLESKLLATAPKFSS